MRTILLALICLASLAACGATSDAPPGAAGDAGRDVPAVDAPARTLAGQAVWIDSCPSSNPCNPRAHSIRGERGAAAIDVDCSLRAAGGGYEVSFRIATITQGGNFDESSEGLSVTGSLLAVGQEMRSGAATVRGLGWALSAVPIGPAEQCHAFIDRIASGGFVGRIACPMAVDTSVTPSRVRIIRGAADEFGTFAFTDCALR